MKASFRISPPEPYAISRKTARKAHKYFEIMIMMIIIILLIIIMLLMNNELVCSSRE